MAIMTSQSHKHSKSTKPPNQPSSSPPISRSSSSSLSPHFAMVELKQRILTSLFNLSDRDTYQIAVEDLEKIIQTLSPKTIPMILNCLYDASNDSKPAVKKESLRLLTVVCASHNDLASIHLSKIIASIVKRLRDSDSGVKDACGDAIGALSMQYLKGASVGDNGDLGSVVTLFVKPLFDAMSEQDKGVQSGAATCMVKMVECASNPPILAFQKLCPRVCKLLNNPNFLAKAAILPVVASLSQVGAIAPQSFDQLLPSIHECLNSTDWVTRKAAADALSSLALHSSSLVMDGAASTLVVLEACRFDKIKPVRYSMTEALQLWKKISGKGDETPDDPKPQTCETSVLKKVYPRKSKIEPSVQDLSANSSSILHFSIEVVVPRRCINSSSSNNEEEPEASVKDLKDRINGIKNVSSERSNDVNSRQQSKEDFAHNRCSEKKVNGKELRTKAYNADDRIEIYQRKSSANHVGFSKTNGESEGSFANNRRNWLAIQRQLLQLERQQAHLMNMVQDFMGVSHDTMVTLENRVRGLERVIENMAQDISISSVCRGDNFTGFKGCSSRRPSQYNSFADYYIAKYGKSGDDGRFPFGERLAQSDGNTMGMKARGPS